MGTRQIAWAGAGACASAHRTFVRPGDRHSGGVSAGSPDFTSHVYALRYTYDLEGRRTDLYHPDGVEFCPDVSPETGQFSL